MLSTNLLIAYFNPDVNECDMGTDMCDNETVAECTNTIGSYECSCRLGFTGDGFNCSGMILISMLLKHATTL